MPQEDNPSNPESSVPVAVRRNAWWWVRLVLALGMIVGVVIAAKPAALWRTLAAAKYIWVIAAIPCAIAAVSLDALKLYWLMKPHGFSGGWWGIVRTNLVVNAVSLLSGMIGGGAVAWYRLSRPDNLRAQTFVALALNTILKLVVAAGAGAVALALDLRGNEDYRLMIAPLFLLAALPLIALGVLLWTDALTLLKRIHAAFFARIIPGRGNEALLKMAESMERYRSHRSVVLGALVAGAARKLIENFIFVFALASVGVEISFVRVLWIMCAVEATGMLPFSLAGFGLPQVAWVWLLARFGVGAGSGLAANLIAFAAMLPVYLSGVAIMLSELRIAHSSGEKKG